MRGASIETAVNSHIGLQTRRDLAQILALLRIASILNA